MMRVSSLFGVLALLGASAGACATGATGALPVPAPFPRPGGWPASWSGETSRPRPAAPLDGYALTGTALALRGAPYRAGGTDPSGFDCSGFIQYVFAQHGVDVPRLVPDLFHAGVEIAPDQVLPGDLLFFTTIAPGPSHVAIALGGDEFVHAPSSRGEVRVERLSSSYWAPRFLGARRLVR